MKLANSSVQAPEGSIRAPEKILIFVHIPKNAGTTFTAILKRQHPEQATFSAPMAPFPKVLERLELLSEAEKGKMRCTSGHIPFGLHRYLEQECDYITILRDPIDRIISHYFYNVRKPHSRIARGIASKNIRLEEYSESGLAPDLING